MRVFRLVPLFLFAFLFFAAPIGPAPAQTTALSKPAPALPPPLPGGTGSAIADQVEAAVPMTRMLDASLPCPVGLPGWATPSERFAWERICTGLPADMRLMRGADDGKGCKATDKAEVWPPERQVTARFIKLIATREPYIGLPAQNAVTISCAEVVGTLDLYQEGVPQTLNLTSNRIRGGVSMVDTHFGSDLNLDGSDLGGQSFWAEGVTVGDDLFLRNGSFGYVMLTGAKVGGNVELNGSVVRGQYENGDPFVYRGLRADSIDIGGHLIVAGHAGLDGVTLSSARVAGDIYFGTSIISGVMRADAMNVGGSVFLSPSTQMFELSLIATKIGNDLNARGLKILKPAPVEPPKAAAEGDPPPIKDYPLTGSFQADRMIVGSTLFLNGVEIGGDLDLQEGQFTRVVEMDAAKVRGTFLANGASFGSGLTPRWGAELGDVNLTGAAVDGTLQMNGSTFTGKVDLSGARIGELWLSLDGSNITWGPDAAINLSNADVGVLQSRMPQDWLRQGGTKLPTRLENFRYDRLTGDAPAEAGGARPKIDSASLIDWVRGAVQHGDVVDASGFVPQPFRQLEETLRGMGADEQADEVRVAGHRDLMGSYAARVSGWVSWMGDGVWWALVGFGAYPFRVLWWFAALVTAGIFVARQNSQLRARGWTDCFWFSLENGLPLVQPSAEHQHIAHESNAARNFFHFQKVAGFVLATILVGALSGLGG